MCYKIACFYSLSELANETKYTCPLPTIPKIYHKVRAIAPIAFWKRTLHLQEEKYGGSGRTSFIASGSAAKVECIGSVRRNLFTRGVLRKRHGSICVCVCITALTSWKPFFIHQGLSAWELWELCWAHFRCRRLYHLKGSGRRLFISLLGHTRAVLCCV